MKLCRPPAGQRAVPVTIEAILRSRKEWSFHHPAKSLQNGCLVPSVSGFGLLALANLWCITHCTVCGAGNFINSKAIKKALLRSPHFYSRHNKQFGGPFPAHILQTVHVTCFMFIEGAVLSFNR